MITVFIFFIKLPVFPGRRPGQASEACEGVSKGRSPLAGQAGGLQVSKGRSPWPIKPEACRFPKDGVLGRSSRRLAPAEQAKPSKSDLQFSFLNTLQRDVLSFGRRPKLNTASGHIPAQKFFAARVLVL